MALKPDRDEMHYDSNFYCNTVVEAGGVMSVVTGGTGGYPGSKSSVAGYVVNPSGAKPVGIQLQDVVDRNTNREHPNWEKIGFIADKGSKALLLTDGWVTTNMIASGVTVAAGDTAYLAASGLVSNVQATGAPKVGRFTSSKDQDGYARFWISL